MPCNVARDALTCISLPKSFWKGGVCQELEYLASVSCLPQRLVELGPCLLESLLWKHLRILRAEGRALHTWFP